MVQTIILAAGKSTRLAGRLRGKAKPLVDADGVSLLKRQIDNLITYGVDDMSCKYIKDSGTPARLSKAVGHLRRGVVEQAWRRHIPEGRVPRPRRHAQPTDRPCPQARGFHPVREYRSAVLRLSDAEYRVVIVTDWSVLARACTVAGLAQIHAKLEGELSEAGASLDAIYYCPHHPHKGYAGEVSELQIDCLCHRPGTLMIAQDGAARNTNLYRSWMVEDSTADIAMARKAGIRSIPVGAGGGGHDGKWPDETDVTANTLDEAVDIILPEQDRAAKPAISETMQP